MKANFNMGEGGLKGMLARHVEKMLFALAILLTIVLVWSGFQRRNGLETNQSASVLKQKVNTVRNQIDQFTWETTFKDLRDTDQRFRERAKDTLEKLAVADFTWPQMLSPPPLPPRSRRIDPEIYPAFDLYVVSGYGAYQKPQENDPTGRPMRPDRNPPRAMDLLFNPTGEDDGMRPLPPDHPAGRMGGMGGRGPAMPYGGTDVESRFFVAITGLVPFKEQFNQYLACFSNTTKEYDAQRDHPNYLAWVLQRAKIDDPAADPKWEQIHRYSNKVDGMANAMGRGGAMMQGGDEIDPAFQHPILTQPIKGLLLRNMDVYARHPNVPRMNRYGEFGGPEDNLKDGEADTDGEEGEDLLGLDGNAYGLGGGLGGNPYGGRLNEFDGPGRELGSKFGGGGAMGYGAMGYGAMGRGGRQRLADYFMFRYFDLNVKPGEAYQYRLQLWIEDPNQPRPPTQPPNASSLDPKVKDRLASQPKLGKRKNIPKFYRETEWSEPSQIVRVTYGNKLLTGETKAARPMWSRDPRISFYRPGDEPEAEMMLLQWDKEYIANVPGEQTLKLGSVPNFKIDTEVLIGQQLKTLEDYPFKAGSVVVDIEGGADMGIHDLTAPGEVLVWSAHGDLVVLDELENAEEFALHHYEPEEELDAEEGAMRGYPGGNGKFDDLLGDESVGSKRNRRPRRGGGR